MVSANRMRFVCAATIVLSTSITAAQPTPEPTPTPTPAPTLEPAPPAVPEPSEAVRALAAENSALVKQVEKLTERIEILEEDQKYAEEKLEKLSPISSRISGYLDLGFFSPSGDGTGIRSDIGFVVFPEYSGRGIPDSWVFMGDPLSTMVNSRGDPATTGESRAITFDAIGGRTSTFLVNSFNMALFAEVGTSTVLTAKVDFLPRGRDVSNPDGTFLGDYVDVRLAYAEHRIEGKRLKASLFAGKFDSVIGFEYRSQEAPSRIEVTPSLICRYTCGYPIGVKSRLQMFGLTLNAAVTNGSSFSEGFAFYNEIDKNQFKTASGRLSYRFPVGGELEVGVSGLFGAQDNQTSEDTYQRLGAIDAHYHRDDLVLRAEFVQGRARGATEPGESRCGIAPCLKFKGALGLVGYRATNVVMPYVRVDWRDALHEAGASFLYVSELVRITPGIRLTLTDSMIFKAEYTVNRELGRIPQFSNDMFTSSFVVKY
jgi:hypothetical protein